MKIIRITENKKRYLELLLLADEQESMLDRYLERGEMFLLDDEGVKAVCVVTEEGNGVCELKNIAVTLGFQRKGYGKKLVGYLLAHYSGRFCEMIVGTGEVPAAIGFYENCGFTYSHRVENFFTDHYDRPLIEEGILLKDMIYLKRPIPGKFAVRIAVPADIQELRNLYKDTVLTVNRRDYSQAEVEDWASCGDNVPKLEKMLETHYFIVAVDSCSRIIGFSSITPEGYLHSMFVHKDFQGEGIATLLLRHIEQFAKDNGIEKITSEVSLTARPFFEKRGYTVACEQKRKANRLFLTNFWMAKKVGR